MVPTGSSFGQLLRNYRLKAQLTQKALGEMMENPLRQGVISWFESGAFRPSKARTRELARCINSRLPEGGKIDEEDWMQAWGEIDKFRQFRQDEINEMRTMRSRRTRVTGFKNRCETRYAVSCYLEPSYIEEIDSMIGLSYSKRSLVMRELIVEALKNKKIVKKIRGD